MHALLFDSSTDFPNPLGNVQTAQRKSEREEDMT